MSMDKKIAELKERREKLYLGGGEDKLQKQREQGKLTARERLAALLDPNTMQEAGSLMGPVMLLLMFPYMLSPMIGRAPNSPLSVAMSFIPPINSFAMMTRMSSESPPPSWQIWLTLLIGIGTVFAAIWFAGKIFKVGLLMHGKPPNIGTLIRWARQA